MEHLFIKFTELPTGLKTKKISVSSVNGIGLGIIKFRPQWRAYVFEPFPNIVLDSKCMRNITEELEFQTNNWRNSLTNN